MNSKLYGFLEIINRNCESNINLHGWAATKELSIADVALLTWFSSIVFNPFRKEKGEEELEKFPILMGYW